MPVNESIPYRDAGGAVTGKATAAITGKRFVKISGNRTGGGGGGLGTDLANVYQLSNCTVAGEYTLGVSKYDAANGSLVGVHTTPGMHVPVTAGATLTAGTAVMTDATGQAIPWTTGNIVAGYCMNGAASTADAEIKLR
jgi:hypothetical protein